jgi:hypothetical protein
MTRRMLEIVIFLTALILAAAAFHAWLATRDDQQRLQATLSAQQKLIASADAQERARTTSLNDALDQIEKLKRASQTPQQIAAALQNYLSLPRPLTLADSPLPQSAAAGAGKSQKTRKGTGGANRPNLFIPLPANPENDSKSDEPPISDPRGQISSRQSSADLRVTSTYDCTSPTPCEANATRTGSALPPSIAAANAPKQLASTTQDPCLGSPSCNVQIPSADLKPLYNYVQTCRECQLRLDAANQNLADDAKKIAALTTERDAAVTAAKGGTFWRRMHRNLIWFAVGAAVATAYNAKH